MVRRRPARMALARRGADDRASWPEIPVEAATLALWQSDNGFVVCKPLTAAEAKHWRAEAECDAARPPGFGPRGRGVRAMSALLIFLGAALLVIGVALQANRAGYLYFVIGSRTVLFLALALAIIVLILRSEI